MSISRTISFRCPVCEGFFPLVQWINMTPADDPTIREKVLTGDLFHAICPHCGKHMMMAYNCLYQDSDLLFAVSLQANGKQPAVAPLLPKYHMRIERSLPTFIERIRILDAGLDDMAFELLRTIVLSQMRQRFTEKNITCIRFDARREEELYLQISQNEQIKLPFDAYQAVADSVHAAGFHPKISGYLHIHSAWVQQSGILDVFRPK